MCKISIIVPIYNVEKYIDRCLKSILAQSYSDFEVILVNDGSTDLSGIKCEEWIRKDNRIRLIEKENGGLSSARNSGLKVAVGDYLLFIDSDDYVKENMFEVLINEIGDNDLLIFNYFKVTDNGDLVSKSEFADFEIILDDEQTLLEFLLKDFFQYHHGWEVWNRFYKHSLISHYNLEFYDNNLIFAEDIDFNFRIACHAKKIKCINHSLYNYLVRDNSLMGIANKSNKMPHFNLLSKHLFKFCVLNNYTILIDKFYLIHYGVFSSIITRTFEYNSSKIRGWSNQIIDRKYYRDNLKWCVINRKEFIRYFGKIEYLKVVSTYLNNYTLLKCFKKLVQKKRIYKYKIYSKKSNIIYLIGTEDFGNLGDHHIAMSEIKILNKFFPDKKIVEIPASKYFNISSRITDIVGKNDIFLTGGGNMGTLYPLSEKIRLDIISKCTQNKITVFPITAYYEKEKVEELVMAQMTINSHKRLTIMARDLKSYNFILENFDTKVKYTPDIVLTSSYNVKLEREIILFCMRSDKEKSVSESSIMTIRNYFNEGDYKVVETDTQFPYNISINERKSVVNATLNLFASSKVVITDRLHGMIFAVITGTPCIVFDNYNGKVLGVYKWLENNNNIYFVDVGENIDVKRIQELINQGAYYYKSDLYLQKFDFLRE